MQNHTLSHLSWEKKYIYNLVELPQVLMVSGSEKPAQTILALLVAYSSCKIGIHSIPLSWYCPSRPLDPRGGGRWAEDVCNTDLFGRDCIADSGRLQYWIVWSHPHGGLRTFATLNYLVFFCTLSGLEVISRVMVLMCHAVESLNYWYLKPLTIICAIPSIISFTTPCVIMPIPLQKKKRSI